jgi:glycosyltransferase involved in cell wall biosynthesis
MMPVRVALVVHRYGPEIGGGSEQLCRSVAERLARHYPCTVITTCAKDYVTWKNEFPPGEQDCNGVQVFRFPVDNPRDPHTFNDLSARVLSGDGGNRDLQQAWMKQQGPYSTQLLSFIDRRRSSYDVFIFFTYLYCTTFFGLPLVRERAILVPTAHDEPPIYLPIFDELFRSAKRLLFLTPEEQAFVLKRFCLPDEVGDVVGFGLDRPTNDLCSEPGDCGQLDLGRTPYVLYLGRIDEGKGCRVLFDFFQRFIAEHPGFDVHLVLAGAAAMPIPSNPRIIPLGYVSETQKRNLISNSLLMIAPSPYESLCIAALESWSGGRAVLVNGNCDVLAGQCRRSGGGLWYRDYEEFAECMSLLLSDAASRLRLGASGCAYVTREYNWPSVEARYAQNILRVADQRPASVLHEQI